MRKSDNSGPDEESLEDILLDKAFWAEFAQRNPGVKVLTYDEAMSELDAGAMHYFGIGADEFIRRWDRREFSGDDFEIASMLSWTIPAKWPK